VNKVESKKSASEFIQKSIIASAVVSSIGNPSIKHKEYAKKAISKIPDKLRELARDNKFVCYILYFLFFDRTNIDIRKRQEKVIGKIPSEIEQITDDLKNLPRELFLPLVELLLPVIKMLEVNKQKELLVNVKKLILMDGKIDDFEFVYYSLLRYGIDTAGKGYKSNGKKLRNVNQEISILLSFLAYQGSSDQEKASNYFKAGAKVIGVDSLSFLTKDEINISNLGFALKQLSTLVYLAKEKVITACSATILADDVVKIEEKETLRAVSAVLGCPMPPII
jgi:hypothetical protein